MKRALTAILLLLGLIAPALPQSAPANLPYHTLYGRLGAVPGDTGPGQAIPFEQASNLLSVTSQRVFSTLASFQASIIPANYTVVTTLGRTTVGDNGGASYIRIAPSTAAAWRVRTPDGQWWTINNRTITPEMLGCFSGTDCTSAFASMSTLLNTLSGGGGIVVNFTPNADYKIWPAGTTPSTAISLNGLSGVTFNFNGARISTNNEWTAPNAAVFSISHSSGLVFNNPSYACLSCSGAIDFTKYGLFFYVNETAAPWSSNIQIFNATQFWGSAFLSVAGDLAFSSQDQAHNITVINADLQHVFYGLNFQGSGDNVFARGVKCTDCGRIYFPWMVSNHDVELIKNGGGSAYVSVLLATYGWPAANELRRGLSNIRVKYRDDSATAADGVSVGFGMSQAVPQVNVSGAVNNGGGLVRLTVNSTANMATGQTWFVNSVGGITGTTNSAKWPVTVIDATHLDLQGSTFAGTYTSGGYLRVPASLRDISVQVENTLAVSQPTTFATFKFNSDGTNDTTTDGHTIENITLSGSLRHYDYGVPALSLFANNGTSTGTWVGETIRNVILRDLTISGTNSSAIIDATNIQANLVLENVWSTPTTVPWTLTGTGANYRPINVSGTGINDRLAVEPASAPAHNFLTGLNSSGQFTGAQPVILDISGWGTGVAAAAAVNLGSPGAFVSNGGVLGTPASGTATNLTGLPISTGITGLGTGVATALATNTNTTGAPMLYNGSGGTPSSIVLTFASGFASSLTAGDVLNAPVIAKVLTGFTSGAGTVSAADSILSALQKINGNDALKAPLASPTFTGTATVPTINASTHTAPGALTFQSNGSTFAGSISTGQQWFMGATSLTPAAGTTLTASQNTGGSPGTSAIANILTQAIGADGAIGLTTLDTFGNQGFFAARHAGNTQASKTATGAATNIFTFGAQGWDTSAYATGAALDFSSSSNIWSASNHGMAARIRTTTDGTTSLTERFRVTDTGGVNVGSTVAVLATSEVGMNKISASGSAPGAGTGKLAIVAGTTGGTCKLIMYAGTSTTPTTIIDNVGSGC